MHKPTLAFVILLFFSVVMGSFVHEFYHAFEYGMYDKKVNEICVVGYTDTNSTIAGAFGWVRGERGDIKEFRIPFSFNDVIPYTLQIITMAWCYFGLLHAFTKKEVKKLPPTEGCDSQSHPLTDGSAPSTKVKPTDDIC